MTEVFHHHHHHHQDSKTKPVVRHKENWINIVDELVYFFSTVGLLMTLPQILAIWVEKNAAGVSALSWIAYLFGALFWTLYGIAHKSKPIFIINMTWVILDIVIIIGTFSYGGSL